MDNNMQMYVKLYFFYRTALMRTVRLLIFGLLLFVIVYQLSKGYLSPGTEFFLNIFLMMEIFFRYKVARVKPTVTVAQNNGDDVLSSFTLQALYGFTAYADTAMIIKKLLALPQIEVLLQKAAITRSDIIFQQVDKKELAKAAFDTAASQQASFVTTLDVVVAYLQLTESTTKLLFQKQLKTDDLETIVRWVRKEFFQEEHPRPIRVLFQGNGIGEGLVSAWTYETKKYTNNFTDTVQNEKPLIEGREKEFRMMLEGLVKLQDNNVLLVGDIGAGKENLVRALAYYSYEGSLGVTLSHRRVYELLAGPLTAGVSNRSDLEVRLLYIISEISHTNDVILYIPDFQNIVGSSSYNLDLSGVLLPYLKAGSMPIVATMTTGTYKKFMEHNPLKEAFSLISLATPEKDTAIQMVLGDSKRLERKYHVIITYAAVKSAVEYADRFMQDAVLPGSALSLLETVANSVWLDNSLSYFDKTHRKLVFASQVIRQIELTTHVAVGTPDRSEADLLLHLEDKLHQKVIGQQDAIKAISEAMRRVRSGMQEAVRPVSFLFLGPTGVGKTETAKALAELYYGGEKHMIRLDMSEYTDESGLKRLLGAPPGEGDERGELTEKVHDNPSSLILLDEFEKAHPDVHNLFLQVLDDGRLTDNKGVTVSFSNSIIIATSNAASEFIREEVEKGVVVDKVFQQKLLDYLQTKAIFKPELLNRFDGVVTFKPLEASEITQVSKLMLVDLVKSLAEQDITLLIDDAVVAKIAKEGYDREFGARPLRRYLQDTIEDVIAKKKLNNEIVRGNTAKFSVDPTGSLQLTVSE